MWQRTLPIHDEVLYALKYVATDSRSKEEKQQVLIKVELAELEVGTKESAVAVTPLNFNQSRWAN